MPNNIEIKAQVSNLSNLQKKVEELCGKHHDLLYQRDIFYTLKKYRIKLRNVNEKFELILYKREDTSGPKKSSYIRIPVVFPQLVHTILKTTLGIRSVVEKKRVLFFSGQTRIHLDNVENLGTFLEFEVVLDDKDSQENGISIANNLMKQLGIRKTDLISGSYIDLIEKDSHLK
nr:class IV adenylate cyclase [Pseudodesulfovibrio sp.]